MVNRCEFVRNLWAQVVTRSEIGEDNVGKLMSDCEIPDVGW